MFTKITRISKVLGMRLEPDCPSVAPHFPTWICCMICYPIVFTLVLEGQSLGYMLLKSTSTSHEMRVEIL
ncbi:Cytokinesis protein sepA [Fusarium oxysporum f. sp. albedinis]|nr:Cytokinesis protein sepA [Fusarium oxysporum f. sp. albedinis]